MSPAPPITQCQRCGTCCRRGGPTLHLEDQALVESGKIPLKHLFTIRQGEPAYDNVAGVVAPAVTDIIKLKGLSAGSEACCFYDADSRGCRLYAGRPAECRALKCWDTRQIEDLYSCRRLTRRHLLSQVEGLWDLVQDHQERCDYSHVAELASAAKLTSSAKASQKKLLELIRYDESLRQITCDKARVDPEILPFLFGRPIAFTIQMFQLKLERTDHGRILQPLGSTHRPVCYRRQ
jgi:Fe-S-cluster containining protein